MLAEPVPCSQKGCRHYRGVEQPDGTEATERHACAAFPGGIPGEIVTGKNMHTAPYPGDHGVRFEPAGSSKDAAAAANTDEGA